MMEAILVLADGRYFTGRSFGASGEVTGEVVFNTSMTGYQEVLTDPSCCGEIVTMTYPLIGNCGVNAEDVEASRPFLSAFIVKESSEYPSNWRSEMTLDSYLKLHGVIGLQGIDTRALVLHIRSRGTQAGIISTVDTDPQSLVEKVRRAAALVSRDLVEKVSCKKPYEWYEGIWDIAKGYTTPATPPRYKIVVYDYGIKRNILRNLASLGCAITVVPARTAAEDVLGMNPDGVFLSNGPGDPEPITCAQENIRCLVGKVPIFGIGLGHQLIALALGGKTFKLKFGHRGANQPVQGCLDKNVEITSQNHGFAVDGDSLPDEVDITHINLNDHTVEGLSHRKYPVFSVQYYPEASSGVHKTHYLFSRFIQMMDENRNKSE